MRISIGAVTEEAMKQLEIRDYPFSPEELSINFRAIIKLCHPDVVREKDGVLEEKAKRVITAYKHLKNLAVSFMVEEKQKTKVMRAFEEDEDLFTFWDTCPECKGKGKVERPSFLNSVRCDECDPIPKSESVLYDWFGWAFKHRDPSIRSSGTKTLKCRACQGTGKFKQKSGKVVDCYRCKGNGIFRKVRCRKCDGTGVIYRKEFIDCWKCEGLGKIKLDLFNPVIRKGSILFS